MRDATSPSPTSATSTSGCGDCPEDGLAERWVGSVRRELLDHVVVLGERHLRRLLRSYVAYYHDDRTHLGLGKQTPASRERLAPANRTDRIMALPRLGGLHHRYQRAA